MRTNLKGQRKNEGVQEIEAHLVGRNKVPFEWSQVLSSGIGGIRQLC